jgi:inner membrane protein
MASVGHIAVGMVAARIHQGPITRRWAPMVGWAALSFLPDADVIGFALGIDYADTWGHRGATHSLAFSVAVGLAVGLAARTFGQRGVRTALIASTVLASHAILDTMTDGGLGCALFWPFDTTRYFAPWRPIPVSPIGFDLLSPSVALIALTELILFAPLVVLAVRPRLVARPVTAVLVAALWSCATWLILSGDRMREGIVGFVLREDTAYASGFSEEGFHSITAGKSDSAVRQVLGAPLREDWIYSPLDEPLKPASERSAAAAAHECLIVRFEHGAVVSASFSRGVPRQRGQHGDGGQHRRPATRRVA